MAKQWYRVMSSNMPKDTLLSVRDSLNAERIAEYDSKLNRWFTGRGHAMKPPVEWTWLTPQEHKVCRSSTVTA